VGREDVVVPPLKPGANPGIGDVPEGYHVIPSPRAQRVLLSTTNRNAWAKRFVIVNWPELRIRR
jgi:hypothetical protein